MRGIHYSVGKSIEFQTKACLSLLSINPPPSTFIFNNDKFQQTHKHVLDEMMPIIFFYFFTLYCRQQCVSSCEHQHSGTAFKWN